MYNPQLAGTSTADQNASKWLNIADELNQAAADLENIPTEQETEIAAGAAIEEAINNEVEQEQETSPSEVTDFQTVTDLESEQKAEIAAGAAIEAAEETFATQENEPEETTQTEILTTEDNDSKIEPDNSKAEASESKETLKNKEILGSTIGSLSKIIIVGEAQQSEHESIENINRHREQKHTLGVLQEAYGRLESDKDQQNLPLEGVFAQVANHFLSLGKLNLELSEDPENQGVISEDSETGETLNTVYYQQAEACYWRASIASNFASGKFENFRTSLDKQVAELAQQESQEESQQESNPAAEAVA